MLNVYNTPARYSAWRRCKGSGSFLTKMVDFDHHKQKLYDQQTLKLATFLTLMTSHCVSLMLLTCCLLEWYEG
jgi:hypothetical protein